MPDDFSSNYATSGVILIGSTATGVIETAGDEDWFAVILTGGASYLFEGLDSRSGGGTLSSMTMGVYSATGALLQTSFLGDYIGINPSITGIYYLAVGNRAETGSYSLRLTQGPKDDYLEGRGTAATIAVGTKVSGTIGIPTDDDWFAVSLEAGKTYLFSGGDSSNSVETLRTVYLNLYGTSGSFITSSYSSRYIEYTPTQSGVYFVGAESFPGQFETGTYTIALSQGPTDDYPSSRATTGWIAVDSEIEGIIGVPSDTDWFAIDLDAGFSYLVKISDASSGGGTLPNGYINAYNAAGSYIGSGNNTEYYVINPMVSARYYISIASFPGNYDIGTYTVSLTKGELDDYSSNSSTKGALLLGSLITGSIGLASDIDWFSLDVEAGKVYLIEGFDAASQGGTLPTIDVSLYNSSGGLVSYEQITGLGDDRYLYKPTATGRVFVGVDAYSIADSGTYSLKASVYVPPSLSISAPTVIEGGSGVTRQLGYVVTLSQPALTSVSFVAATSSGGTAEAGSDYSAVSRTISISKGSTTATISVNVAGDNTIEGDETVELILSQLTSSAQFANGANSVTGIGTITNDDFPSLSIVGASVTEGNAGANNGLRCLPFGGGDSACHLYCQDRRRFRRSGD